MKLSLRKPPRGFTLVELIQVTSFLAVAILFIWVVVHFIGKFW